LFKEDEEGEGEGEEDGDEWELGSSAKVRVS
jgi:hypothetical protein